MKKNLYLASIKYTNNKIIDIWEDFRLIRAYSKEEAEEKLYDYFENSKKYPKKVKITETIE